MLNIYLAISSFQIAIKNKLRNFKDVQEHLPKWIPIHPLLHRVLTHTTPHSSPNSCLIGLSHFKFGTSLSETVTLRD